MNNLSISDMELVLKKLNKCQTKLKSHIKDMEHSKFKLDRDVCRLKRAERTKLPLPKIKVVRESDYSSSWTIVGTKLQFFCSSSYNDTFIQQLVIKNLQNAFLMEPCRTQDIIYISNKH